MPSPEYERLRRLFDLAFDASPSERETILSRECAGDPSLRRRVEAMLAGLPDERFLADPTVDKSAAAAALGSMPFIVPTPGEQPGDRIGPYKLLTRIGEGGFGSVFLAEQDVPVKRRVALKIIKLGMDTKQVVARFEQERQALAIMDHPHVARVYDAGATESGRPYFVMEFCAGDAITDYCDRNHLNIRDRLTLFLQVCTAVQHAHQRGLIHRDIKPSNVLVTTQDGKPHAKVIDFGIAKATVSKLTEKTLFTEHRQLIGTPEYMSPEQAEGSLDIDTRTDVYALGVLLYELLTGLTPFDARSLRSATYAEMQRIIREVDPPKPSTRIKQSVDTASDHASRRRVEPRRLDTMLRGELDWIVMKAIEKDRGRRYDSPNALATDLQLYLAGEAVTAAPPSRTYLMRKFVRRNKGPVSTVTAVGIALFAGVIAFAWQASVARRERDRAVQAEAETARRAEELQKVSDFQSQMLAQIEPADAGLRLTADVRARFDAALLKFGAPQPQRDAQSAAFAEAWSRINSTDAALALVKSTLFVPALDAIDRRFADQPTLNATLRTAIATRYLDLGLYEDALKVFDEAYALRRRALGPDHPETLALLVVKSKALSKLGRNAEAEAIVRPVVETLGDPANGEDPLALSAIEMLGESRLLRSQPAEAESLFRRSLAGRRKLLGDDHEDTLQSMGNLAMALRGVGTLAEAETLTREAMQRRQRIYGEGNPFTLSSYNNLAVILLDLGRVPEALDYFQKSADGRRRVLGEAHRDTLITRGNVATALNRLGRSAEAVVIQRELFDLTRRTLGPDHPDTLLMLTNLSSGLIEVGKLDEAEPLCRESLERQTRAFGPKSAAAAFANNLMAYVLRRQSKHAEAEPYIRTAVEIAATAFGPDHPDRFIMLNNLGSLKRTLGDLAASETLYRECLERSMRILSVDHPSSLTAALGLAETLAALKRHADVEQVLADAEPAFRRAASKSDEGNLRRMLVFLGRSRAAQRKFALAEANLKEAYDLYVASSGPDAKGAQVSAGALADLYQVWHEVAPAGGYDAQSAAWRVRVKSITTAPTPSPATRASPTTMP